MLPSYLRRVIGLDVDDVLLLTLSAWLKEYRLASGYQLYPADIHEWNLDKYILPAWRSTVENSIVGNGRFHQLRTPELYRVMRPLPGAVAGVRELARQGHTLVAVSADYATHVAEKARAVRRWFPDIQHIVITRHKACVKMDVLIDDGAHNLGSAPVGYLFNSPTNLSYAGTALRVDGWEDIPWRFSC